MTATKTSARDKLLAHAAKQGWELDPTVTINTHRDRFGEPRFHELPEEVQNTFFKQNPLGWTKPAAGGGRWQVIFDYDSRSYRGNTNRLNAVQLRYYDADGNVQPLESVVNFGVAVLQTPSRSRYWRNVNWLWEVTGDYDTPLTKRVQTLLEDPDLVVWLAAEQKEIDRVATEKRREEERIDRELRDRPLPKGWESLKAVAQEVTKADGKTNVAELLNRLQETAKAVENSLSAGYFQV